MIEVKAVMVTSIKRTYASMPWLPGLWHSVPILLGRPLSTRDSAGDPWTLTGKSGSVSCGVTAPLFWVLCAQDFVVPSKSLFPQSCGSSVIKSH